MESSHPFQRGMVKRKSVVMSSSDSFNNLYRPEFQNSQEDQKEVNQKIWKLMSSYLSRDKETIQKQIVDHVEYTLAQTRFDFKRGHAYQAIAHSVRDRLLESFNDTQQHHTHKDVKRVYYLSLEFLIGRTLQNALINLNIEKQYKEALMELGFQLESIYEEEVDAALGNGGLGRLAACFLDSLATLNYPAWGYGIRYNYGIFKQIIRDGYQIEAPDFWLSSGYPWEIERIDISFPVRFYGHSRKYFDERTKQEKYVWEGGDVVVARAYDNPIPGYGTFSTINLRLWRSLPNNEFDFNSFNSGNYFGALEERQKAEFITSVLYPNDNTLAGKELRLKQQYLLVSATIKDVLRRFKQYHTDFALLPEKSAFQLNDTHPAIAIIELLRILVDEENLEHEKAWGIVYHCFSYTNHTILPEALEKWPADLFGRLLPRHLEIIYLVNFLWLQKVAEKYPGNIEKLQVLSIIEQGSVQKIRMANLSIVGSHTINGVAFIHSELLKTALFKDFYEMVPKKFQNKTNGVTPRRWLRCCNPKLAAMYDRLMKSDEWIINMQTLKNLKDLANDETILKEFDTIKKENKIKLKRWVQSNCGIEIDENSLFDIQVKRIHEYQRQFMNILYVVHRYLNILRTSPDQRAQKFVPRTIMFGGKAAPAYTTAKRVIKLINAVAEQVNSDPSVNQLLKVVFLPNYCVSNAEIIIPAAELSHHISTAGLEASGTSNMKFVMNGCLIIGTLDGANVEIVEEVGEENMFIFGAQVDEIQGLRKSMREMEPKMWLKEPLNEVLKEIRNGLFGHSDEINGLLDTISQQNDYYLVAHDFYLFLEAQERVDQTYSDRQKWDRMAFFNSILSGKFSSDRTIEQYAKEIWKIEPIVIPNPSTSIKQRVKSYGDLSQTVEKEKN